MLGLVAIVWIKIVSPFGKPKEAEDSNETLHGHKDYEYDEQLSARRLQVVDEEFPFYLNDQKSKHDLTFK